MKTRTKEVRVSVTTRPVTNLSMGVILSRGTYAVMTLDESDIFKCICGKAIVEEKLPDGTFQKLDLFNYNKYNNRVNESDNDEKDESAITHNDRPTLEKKVEPVKNRSAETAHALVNPNVAPVNEKELVNPAAAIVAGPEEGEDDQEVRDIAENVITDEEHDVEDETPVEVEASSQAVTGVNKQQPKSNTAKDRKNAKR